MLDELGDATVIRSWWSKGASRCHSEIRLSMLKFSSCWWVHFLTKIFQLHGCLHSSFKVIINLFITSNHHSSTLLPLCHSCTKVLFRSLWVVGRTPFTWGLSTSRTWWSNILKLVLMTVLTLMSAFGTLFKSVHVGIWMAAGATDSSYN